MGSVPEALSALVRSAVEPLGYEFVGAEYLSGGNSGSLLRVYIDHVEGITVDDCARVSHQLSGVLDVEDPIQENYSLEVSSPGMDRPLFTREHFQRFTGHRANIRLRMKLNGRRRFEGLLQGVEEEYLRLEVDGEQIDLPLEQIDKARLVPEF